MKSARKLREPTLAADRFARFTIQNHQCDPEKTGLLPSELDYALGTARLSRNETITLIGSSTLTGERLLLKLKWRPGPAQSDGGGGGGGGGGGLVTLLSELEFTTREGRTLRHEHLESYAPERLYQAVGAARGEPIINQYGSSASPLKLYVQNPYRRLRLVFSGQMQVVATGGGGGGGGGGSDNDDDGQQQATMAFVRLGCVLTPCGQIFDFLASSSKFASRAGRDGAAASALKPGRPQADELRNFHDRHEQKVRFDGELSLELGATNVCAVAERPAGQQASARVQRADFSLRGFQVRHLHALEAPPCGANYNTTRLFVGLQNGKSFQVGASATTNSLSEPPAGPELRFGYAHLSLRPTCESLADFGQSAFECLWERARLLAGPLSVRGQPADELLTCQLSQPLEARPGCNWFGVEARSSLSRDVDDTDHEQAKLPGWAYWSRDDEILDSPRVCQLIEASRAGRARALNSGELLEPRDEPPGVDMPLVVSIEEAACCSRHLVGAKAASLAQLLQLQRRTGDRAEFQVPFGVVLTRHAFELLAASRPGLREACERLQHEPLSRDQCARLQELVAGTSNTASLPAQLAQELASKLRARYPGGGVQFAVRSSAWGEDEADMSAAGQLKTLLNVPLEASDEGEANGLGRHLASAVLACLASKFSYENLHYQRQHGLPPSLPMAVLIQEMVACQKAGVLFTCDPVSGDARFLTITANFGLGESVVSGAADPDSIRVRVQAAAAAAAGDANEPTLAHSNEPISLSIEEIRVGKKELVISNETSSSEEQRGLANKPALDEGQSFQQVDRSKCCLSEGEIFQLARVGCQLQRYFSSRQRHCDIEFGFLNSTDLFLFQCRPVTGLEAPSQAELMHEFDRSTQTELAFYTRANVGEVMPHAIKPLQLTYAIAHWTVLMSQLQLDFQSLANWQRADQLYVPQCTGIDFVVEKYHAFFNLFGGNFINLAERNKSALTRALEIGMFGRELEPMRELLSATGCFRLAASPFQGFRYRMKTLHFQVKPIKCIERVERRVQRLHKRLLQELDEIVDDRANASASASAADDNHQLVRLYDRTRHLLRENFATWRAHMCATLLDSEYHLQLNKLLANYIDEPVQLCVASNKLLALNRNVLSAEIPQRIRNIAQLIGSAEFLAMDEQAALEHLQRLPEFRQFLDRFGHRCYGEFDVGSARWREQPERLLQMIRANCRPAGGTQAAEAGANGSASCQKPLESGSSSSSNTNINTAAAAAAAASQKQASVAQVLEELNLSGKLSKLDALLLRRHLVPRCRLFLAARERTKNAMILYVACLRLLMRLLARQLRRRARLPDEQLIYFLAYDELELLCRDFQPALVMRALRRRQLFERHFNPDEVWKFPEIIREPQLVPNHLKVKLDADANAAADGHRLQQLVGTPASSGQARGRVCLVRSYAELARVTPGSILVTHSTDIAFSPVFPLISGIITEVGGLISHGAVVAREYGLPSVIGVPEVTAILRDGELILLDAERGSIVRLEGGT